MELKQAGVLLAMLSALERESQSTCRSLDQREQNYKGPDTLVSIRTRLIRKNLLNIK